jgi:hypothetical protein
MSCEESTIEGQIISIGHPVLVNAKNAPLLISPSETYFTQTYLKTEKDTYDSICKIILFGKVPEEYHNMRPEERIKHTMKIKRLEYITDGVRCIVNEVYINDNLILNQPVIMKRLDDNHKLENIHRA